MGKSLCRGLGFSDHGLVSWGRLHAGFGLHRMNRPGGRDVGALRIDIISRSIASKESRTRCQAPPADDHVGGFQSPAVISKGPLLFSSRVKTKQV